MSWGFDENLRRGLESYLAELLRVHVAETLFARPEVRAALPPERLEKLRAEVLGRLRASEEEGREARPRVTAVCDELLSFIRGVGRGGEDRP